MASCQKETYPYWKKKLLWEHDEIHEDIDGSKWDKRAANESLVQSALIQVISQTDFFRCFHN